VKGRNWYGIQEQGTHKDGETEEEKDEGIPPRFQTNLSLSLRVDLI
jgi:hypothetical protein